MQCDICGAKEDLVKVRNEDGETINLCNACYETQYEGFETSNVSESDEEEFRDDDLEEDLDKEDEDFLETEEDSENEETR